MKNNIKAAALPILAVAAGLVFLACIGSCAISFLGIDDPVMLASSMLMIKIPHGATAITNDNSPGLPLPGGASDGYVFIVLQIPPEKAAELIENLKRSSNWHSLPLPEELAQHENLLQPSFGIEGTIPITTSTGYYLFIDSQTEGGDKQAFDLTIPFYNRPSYNFTFGLFNDQDGKLYLWRLDT